jgi:hypothetical protein
MPASKSVLPLGQSVPTHRGERVIRQLLCLPGYHDSTSPMPPKACGFMAIRVPDIKRGAQDIAAGVVNEIAAEVLAAEKNINVPR